MHPLWHHFRFTTFICGLLLAAESTANPVVIREAPVPSPAPRVNSAINGKELIARTDEQRERRQTNPAAKAPGILGETVYARIGATAGDVEGVYEFSESVRELLVPVFVATKTLAAEALNDAQLRVMIDDVELTQLAPTTAPFEVNDLPRGVKLLWFSASAAPADSERLEKTTARTVRLSYRQPLLHDRFLYLPVIAPGAARTGDARNWRYQMFVRSIDRLFSAPEPPANSQHLGDVLVVYLRDRELVDLPVPPRKRPAKAP